MIGRQRSAQVVRHNVWLLVAAMSWFCLPCFRGGAQTLALPSRQTNAPTGSEFAGRNAGLSLTAREAEIFSQVKAGNVPGFLRSLVPVTIQEAANTKTNSVTFYVTPDYLAIGSDADYLRIPISPNLAQRIADATECALPTKKMADAIYRTAAVRLPPTPVPPSAAMTTLAVFSNHNAIVQAQRAADPAPPGQLVAGHKKDLVITPKLADTPGRVAIYGWHKTNGAPIQPLYVGHAASWVDYSQCTRLVSRKAMLNGEARDLLEILRDPAQSSLLSDEGPIATPFYPTNAVAALPKPVLAAAGTNAPGPVTTKLTRESFRPSGQFGELVARFNPLDSVTITVNAPSNCFALKQPVLLVFYALPNGNTTALTIGKVLKPGDDWHFDIQHIGAQTRFVRDALPDKTVVVAYLENSFKSWPTWRKNFLDAAIPTFIDQVKRVFEGAPLEIVLTGHSGGGSLTFGYLNAVESIPAEVRRIAFLDSNYAYDIKRGHDRKLGQWLQGDDSRVLCILAYNDANALLDGKSFVSAAGGTWGKSHEMQRDLARQFPFTAVTNGGFESYNALNGRVRFWLKENPDHKIFHTVQVEKNGFIHALLCNTPLENKGYEYFGERAYTKWIAAE